MMNAYFVLHHIPVKDGEVLLRCTLIAPAHHETPLPGVMIFPDLWGLGAQSFEWGRRLVEEGYVALCVDMFGDRLQADSLDHGLRLFHEVTHDIARWRVRARRVFDAFRSAPQVHTDQVAAIGFCFGGSSALHLACTGAPLGGAVCLHGDIPRISGQDAQAITARLLICNGAADPVVPNDQILDLTQDLLDSGVDWQLLLLGETGHSFTNRDAARANVQGVAFDPRAEHRAWTATRLFLRELFRPSKPVDAPHSEHGLIET